MRRALPAVCLAATLGSAMAGTNAVDALPPIVVLGERERSAAAVSAESPWRGASARLSVRDQGEAAAVADIGINGSSFSEAGIVFNGATVRNAQTEHFNVDVPVARDWLGEPRVLTGLELFRKGAGHPAGSLALELEPPEERGGRAAFGVGLEGLAFGRVNDLEVSAVGETLSVWAGAFLEYAHSDRLDGYDSNAMDRSSAGGRFGFGEDNWAFDSLVSWQWRQFGCRGAYGANEKYPAWEKDRTALVSAVWRHDAGDDQASELTVAWTRGRDDYRLNRHNPGFYRNTHRSNSVTLHGATRRHFSAWAFADFRADADADVYSTVHRTNYTGSDPKWKAENFRRFHGSFAVLPGVRAGNWEFAAGAAGEFFSDYASSCAPAGGVSYSIGDAAKIELSYREGLRMPSYTELTYDSPDIKGTIGLPLQRTRSLNLDAQWENARVGAFAMRSEDLVDWQKANRQAAWKATALDAVTSFGLSADAQWEALEKLTLRPRGAIVLKHSSGDCWASRYAMDFPVASFSLEAEYRILEGWRVSYLQGVEAWRSNPVRRGSSVRNVSRIETVFSFPFCRAVEFTIGFADIFNQAFEIYPGQKASGVTGYFAVTYRW